MILEQLTQQETHLLFELQPEGWSDIIPNFDFYTKEDFCYPIKVMEEETILGIGTSIVHQDVAWLAHIIVHPEHRNKGVGKRITQSLIDTATQQNCRTIYLIATELGSYVYEKLGFVTETDYLFYQTKKSIPNLLKSPKIIPYAKCWKKDIQALDFLVSGEHRLFHLEYHLQAAFLYIENDRLEGYFLPTFGDGLIIAHTAVAGTELMKLRLEREETSVFPSDNKVAIRMMAQYNYEKTGTAKRMRLGEERPVDLSKIYNRIGGNLG